MGQTSQCLQDKILQHVPKSIQKKTGQKQNKQNTQVNQLILCRIDSAIANHLLHNQKCASHYKDNQFSILSKAQSEFHLTVLKSIFITFCKPNLCRQKEFAYKHKLLI